MSLITLEQLKKHVVVRPDTGECFSLSGKKLGTLSSNRYIRVSVGHREYRLHRLVWLWVHGQHPPENMTIDHINGVKTDNRIDNLRLATVCQNIYCHRAQKPLELRNIYKERRGYRVEMSFNGKRIRRRAATLERALEVRDHLFELYPPIEMR